MKINSYILKLTGSAELPKELSETQNLKVIKRRAEWARYYAKNKERIRHKCTPEETAYNRRYYLLHKQDIQNKTRLYRTNNSEKYSEYFKKIYKQNTLHRISVNLRTRLNNSLKTTKTRKNNKTMDYVGCSKEFLINYLKYKFVKGMTWENKNLWHIDHIRPLSSFDLTEESQLFEAMNYKNLQPLWAKDNIKKSNKYAN